MKLTISLLSVLAAFVPIFSADESKDSRGQEIAREFDSRNSGFKYEVADLVMEIHNGKGGQYERTMVIENLEVDGDGDRTLIFFQSPRDIMGTALLIHSHKAKADDQWLFLPGLKRTRRINASSQDGKFMGSEFTFEDLASFEVENYTYNLLREETFNSKDCFVVDQVPIKDNSGYKSQRVWYDKTEFLPRKIEFFGKKDVHVKTLVLSGYEKKRDNLFRPSEMRMEELKSGRFTIIRMNNYAYDKKPSEKSFNPDGLGSLKR